MLCNELHAIIALCSLLLETQLTPEQRVMIETVLKSSNLLATLINDVLDLSRLENGSLELDFEMFNLHGIFKEVVNCDFVLFYERNGNNLAFAVQFWY